jgi:hypothetical protein
LAATIIAITINILANALPINGQNTGEISDRFKVFFVPAGYVFAIWGVIYIGWIAFSIYQLLPAQRNNPRLAKIGDWYILGAVANSVWIFLWHYNYFTLTVLAMLTLLTSLLIIYQRLNIGLTRPSTIERWCVDIPFSVYLGWISVATIANVTDALYDLGWNGGPIAPDAWAVVMLIVALGLSLVLLQTRRDIAYSAVIVWAAVGIAAKQADTALVANAAWAVAVVVALTMAAPYLRRGRMAST